MLHVWGRGEVSTGIWWGNLSERDYLEDPGLGGRIYYNSSSRSGMGTGTGLIWLRIRTGGGL
jgi:hypothetical protein